MSPLGTTLRSARERQGLSLEQAAEETKIGLHHLRALETGDLASLPGPVFSRGFVRSYATYLKIDPEAALRELGEDAPAQQVTPPEAGAVVEEMSRVLGQRHDGRPAGRVPWVVGFVIAGALVLVLGVWLWPDAPRREPGVPADADASPPPAVARPTAPPDAAPETPVPTPEPKEPSGIEETLAEPVVVQAKPAAEAKPDPVPEPKPSPRPKATPEMGNEELPSARPQPTSDLSVPEFGVGTAVVDHRLQGQSNRFPLGTSVKFWTRVTGAAAGEQIYHVWIHGAGEVMTIPLQLGGSHWRTYSSKTLWGEGGWSVEARDAAGRVLARSEFSCVKTGS